MKERPILFNAEMVKAIISGRKTQTRRVLKVQPDEDGLLLFLPSSRWLDTSEREYNCPFGNVGDQLWVREAFRMAKSLDLNSPSEVAELSLNAGYKNPWAPIQLEADGVRTGKWTGFDTPPVVTEPGKLRPSLHMPRWASRIDLLITGVRVERLNAISESDAIAEGLERYNDDGIVYYGQYGRGDCRSEVAYRDLWQSIYGAESWQANPWVWVIEFEHLRAGRKHEL